MNLDLELFTFDENDQPVFSDDYCDFNNNKQIITKKRKFNKKYLVYDKETHKPIVVDQHNPKELLSVLELEEERVVFYVDNLKRLSFLRTRVDDVDEYNLLDKVENKPFFRNIVFSFFFAFIFIGVMRFRSYKFEEVNITLGYNKSLNYKVNFLFPESVRKKAGHKTGRLSLLAHIYWVKVPFKDIYHHYLETSDINTPIYIRVRHEGTDLFYNLKASAKDRYNKKHYLYNTKSNRLSTEKTELFIRKSVTGQYVIVTTSLLNRTILLKEWFAYIISKVSLNKQKYDVYFEKFAMGASESAFELFKHAYEKGDQNCVYLLEREYPNYNQVKDEYGKAVIEKNTFRGFLHIFKARSFISSELVSHIQRRLYDNDSLIKKKILFNRNKIFLQHGVSLATNLFERGYFNKKVPIAPNYILVNSEFEANLFLENTGYKEEQLIPTGLPNLDLYVHSKDEDKEDITFMITWRPWDLTGEIEPGSYLDRYFSFIELVQTNEFYKDKNVNIVLHPKSKIILQEQFPNVYDKYKDTFYDGDIKDALINSKVLISDYSSIVFFAFAGGTNIIFYWEDKELAEEHYGAPNILQKEIAFGNIAYKFDELHKLIEDNYHTEQKEVYLQRYSSLVEFNEGFNTDNTYRYIQKNILNKKAY